VAWVGFWSGIVSALAVLAGVIYTARSGRRSTEQSSQVGFIEQLLARVDSLEKQVGGLWDARRADAVTLRAQGDHIDVLEQHIYRQLPPPPPPRPAGL
jgi:hypothetical protein